MHRAFLLGAGFLIFPSLAGAEVTVPLNVFAAYLHVDTADTAHAATPVALASVGLAPGVTIEIDPIGDWDNGPGPDVYTNTLVVFSGSGTLLGPSAAHRVPDAIAAGISAFTGPTWPSSEPTDIPEDFVILGEATAIVTIPAGATHMFITPAEIYYRDNSDPDGDFAARITIMPATSAPLTSERDDDVFASPNPFRDATTIRFEVPREAAMRITIHDVGGRLVRTLLDRSVAAGDHEVTWEGRNASGTRAAPGSYFARIEGGAVPQTVRVNLVR